MTLSNTGKGDSLIEVMIALSLTAITALGLVAVQGALARGERMALLRERATLIADSVVEGLRGAANGDANSATNGATNDVTNGDTAVSQWRARAAAMLPEGDVAVSDRADGVRIATVSWHAEDRSDPCTEPQAKPLSSCVVVAFAR